MATENRKQYTILLVDDTSENIALLNAALRDEYNIKVATRGRKAIEIARTMPVDLILLDVMMPEMDGFETCRRLKEDPMTRRIPVIFVTARGDVDDESVGFACGGVDYITKPVRYPVVRSRIKTHLALYDQERRLQQLVRERTTELAETRMEILQRLGRAAEYRDNETGRHVIRISHYCHLRGHCLRPARGRGRTAAHGFAHARYRQDRHSGSCAAEKGRLDDGERRIIQQHCVIGHEIIGDHHSQLLRSAAWLRSPTMSAGTATAIPRD